MLRRIFIAINFPNNIKEELAQFKKNWPDLPCRWLKKNTFHMTLAFLGNRSDNEISEIFQACKQATEKNETFSLVLDKICYGPGQTQQPRLIWLKGEKSKALSNLKRDLDELLEKKIGIASEKREFVPHITLARINAWQWRKIDNEERMDINLQVCFDIKANSVEVMESHLTRNKAQYKVLKSFPLIKTNQS